MDPQPAAPPVVAVVVTADPGPWFEEALAALGAQDYPNLSVLVLDAASATDPTARVARVLPGAYVRRVEANLGFAATANEVLDIVEGASHFLVCHDDVAPDPDAVRLLVEEAFRSNAGIVAPKLVDWDDPRRLQSVGATVDKGGAWWSFVEPGELDQAQHDSVRDVFVAPGGCTLVRADLFATLGGFDPAMTLLGEDVDLSWRAQVAGARVVVAPAARVRHRQALTAGERLLPDSLAPFDPDRRPARVRDQLRPLQLRHRLRAVLKNYGRFHLLRVLPQLLVLHTTEAVYALATGRTATARAIAGAWTWNLRALGPLRRVRRQSQRGRSLSDAEVRRLHARGSARIRAFLAGQFGAEDRGRALTDVGRELTRSFGSSAFRLQVAVYAAVALVLLIGSRGLLGDGLPAVGRFAPFPDGPVPFLRHFASGWRTVGLGADSAAPPAFALLGLAGFAVLGAMDLLQRVVVLGALPLGLVGAARLAGPLGSRRATTVCVAVYAAIPLPYNALATGSWAGVVAYATAPWLLVRLFRASGSPPFGAGNGPEERPDPVAPRVRSESRPLVFAGVGAGDAGSRAAVGVAEQPGPAAAEPAPARPSDRAVPLPAAAAGVALVTALAAAFAPAVALALGLAAVGLAVGAVATGSPGGAVRVIAVAAGGLVGAALVLFPWSLELLLPGSTWSAIAGPGPGPGAALGLGEVLRFQTGPLGAGGLGVAFAAAAALPLLVGQGWRFRWAARAWFVALACWGATWAFGLGWFGLAPPSPDVLLAPAGAAVALAVALGMAAFDRDLASHRFGWRQLLAILAAVAAVIGGLPTLVAALDGRWDAPRRDHASQLSWMPDEREVGAYRVLWLGAPEVLPLDGWRLGDDLAYATSRNGPPDATDLWAGSPGPSELLGDAVRVAREGRTTRLGRTLAPMAVRYVVVPRQLAPDSTLVVRRPPADLLEGLSAQVDLRMIQTDESLVVYENTSWIPGRAALSEDAATVSRAPASLDGVDPAGTVPVLRNRHHEFRYSGRVPDGRDAYLAETASRRWELRVDGDDAPRRVAFGWANAFEVEEGGAATLRYRTSPTRWLALAAEALLLAAVYRLATRRREEQS